MSLRSSWMIGLRLWALGIIVLGLMLTGVGSARAQHPEQTPFLNLVSYLHTIDGDTVAQGSAVPFGGCTSYVAAFGTCFGNNRATPYYVLDVPLGGVTLPSYLSGFHPSGNTSINTFYELHENEALITIITLPPPAAYFSQQSYMIERDPRWYDSTNVPSGTSCTPGTTFLTGPIGNKVAHLETSDCSYDVFGFFNNSINNAVVNQQAAFQFSGTPACPSNCAIAIITTPNADLYTHITNVFGTTLGYNTNLLFEEGMSTSSTSASLAALY